MFINVNVDIGNGYFEGKRVEINDEDLVKMIDRYFEVKDIKVPLFDRQNKR